MFKRQKRKPGFELSRPATIVFTDSAFEGAEVEIDTLISLRELFEMRKASAALDDSDDTGPVVPLLLRHIRSWNIELDGRPVPLTKAGIESLPQPLIAAILGGWHDAVTEVPAPLGRRPANGPSSPETESTPPTE